MVTEYPPGLAVPLPPVKGYPLPKRAPSFSFIAGTWGDVQAGLGNHQHIMAELNQVSGDVLYFGPVRGLADWLRIQPGVRSVFDIRSPGPVSGIPTDPERREEWWPRLRQKLLTVATYDLGVEYIYRLGAISAEDLWPCHVDFTLQERLPVHRPELRTAPELTAWAKEALDGIGSRLVLFQPRSETSCLWEGHWPCWHQAAHYLAEEWKLLFCGKGEFDGNLFGAHPQIIDLVNQTPSMPHLFALAEQCERIVTTSNALSLYAAAKGIPAVVCCNTTHRRPEQFFTRFAAAPSSRIVEHWDGMDEFKAAWEGLGC